MVAPGPHQQAYRNGIRVCDLYNDEIFESKLRVLFAEAQAQFGAEFKGDVEAELARYRELRERVAPFVDDTVKFLNDSYKSVGTHS